MAIVRAVKSGNWSDTTVWNTGALPTSADDAYSNTFTVTIDISPTILSISNEATTGVTAGGFFVPTNGITLTCTATNGINRGSVVPIQSSLTAGQSFNVVANINPSGSNSGISNLSNGGVNFTGIVSGGNQASVYGIRNDAAGPITVTGNVQGGSGSSAHGIQNSATGAVMVTGNVNAGGSSASGINNASSGSVTVIGSITPVNNVTAIASANTSSQVLVSGPLLTSANGTNPITAIKWGWINNPSAAYYQVRVNGSGAIRPLYTADSVGGNPAASNVRSGTVYGPSNELTGTCAVPPAGSVALGVPVDNTTGTAVLTQANFQAALDAQGLTSARAAKLDSLDAAVSSRLATSGYTTPPTSTQNASAVRTELSTELARIDSTISSRLATADYTAPLDAAGTRNAVGLASANLDTQFSNIPGNVRTNLSTELGRIDATVSSRLATSGYTTPPTSIQNAQAVRTELAPELGRIDTTVSSRLATTGYTTPPTPVQNATAVRTELTTELTRIDTTVSSRSTFNPSTDTVANVTLVATTTNLTNPPVVPTTTEIASAVRLELTPELDRIDTDVSSRLASADYTVPPTALENAQAVEVQLALPLGNLDAAVSTRSTFDPAIDIVSRVTLVDTTTDLTNPPVVPTPEQIATAVRAELEPELARVENCATVDTTGQQIQNALTS